MNESDNLMRNIHVKPLIHIHSETGEWFMFTGFIVFNGELLIIKFCEI